MFRRIVFSAVLAGLMAGLLLTGVQSLQVMPLIVEAESFENAAAGTVVTGENALADADDSSVHDAQSWAPAEGVERALWTALANVGMAIGFGLLLVAAFSLRRSVSVPQGILWGLAGYAAFYLSPSLGLAPELPGTEAAALDARQAWWIATVVVTGLGLALAALTKSWGLKLLGVALLIVPHVIGAPHPIGVVAGPPAELAQAFFLATAIANAIFWVTLGAGSAFAFRKLA